MEEERNKKKRARIEIGDNLSFTLMIVFILATIIISKLIDKW